MNQQPKSCLGCPSYLSADEASRFFNKGIGSPVCARFGKPIGSRNSTTDQRKVIAESFAEKCPGYGMEKPDIVDWGNTDFRVSLPDPDVLDRISRDERTTPELVNSCSTCEFFVREDTVLTDLGWASGLCSAKGTLNLTNRLVHEARHCDVKSFGSPRSDTNGLHFMPEYQPDFKGIHDPARLFAQTYRGDIEPTEYPSDNDVSSDDQALGIRAWRALEDPRTGNKIHLPVFDLNFFDEEERALIPRTGDDQHPEDYLDYAQNSFRVGVIWLELDETPAFWGESGTGKTEFYRHMAWMMCLPFHRFAIKRSTELDELEGKMQFDPDGVGTYFSPGRFVRAWSKPGVGDLDELNTARPEVFHFLRPILDSSKLLIVDADDGKPHLRNDFFFPGVAMNPAWDMKNLGVEEISDADARRLTHIRMEIPPPEIERKIIKTRINRDGYDFPDDSLNLIMKIAEDIRAAVTEESLPITWGVGSQLKVARAMKWFPVEECYKMAIADFLSPTDYDEFMKYVDISVD